MITVIVPIYNTEKYLKRCLDSILNQTYRDLEIILVDDGSSDNSGTICKNFLEKDKRIVYYKLKNGGQGKARNYALDRCKGEWISFIDSDDWIENDMYEKMIAKAEANDADMAICGWHRNYSFQQREQPCPNKTQIYNNFELMREYLETPFITSSMCNKIYKSYLWQTIRFPETRAREDAATIYKIIAKSKKAVHIGESKYIQYVRSESTERIGFTKNKLCSIDISYEIKKFIEQKYPDLNDLVALKPAEDCANLMEEIISGFSIKKYKDIYYELYNRLHNELLLDYSENTKNTEKYKYLWQVVNHQNEFKINAYMLGVKKYLIDYGKIIYEKIIYKM